MNRRTLKKHCQRAVAILIAKHGYDAGDFSPADGQESIYAPHGMERRFVRYGHFLHPGPLKGTMLFWHCVSYEYDEWDAELASEWLDRIEFEGSITEEDVARWFAEELADAA